MVNDRRGCISCKSIAPIDHRRLFHLLTLFMALLSKVRCSGPFKLFLFNDRVSICPYRFRDNPAQKDLRDNVSITLKEFSYVVSRRSSILISRHVLQISIELYHPARLCSQLGLSQRIEKFTWGKMTLVDVNICWWKCLGINSICAGGSCYCCERVLRA